jgi:hypothetical protein
MKIKLTAHIHYTKYLFEEKGEYQIFPIKLNDDDTRTYIGEQQIEVDVPDNYDPRAQQIAALQKRRGEVMAEYQKTVDDINERINKLQAIEYSGETA